MRRLHNVASSRWLGRTTRLGLAALVPIAIVASFGDEARADEFGVVVPGAIGSIVGGRHPANAIGAELSYMHLSRNFPVLLGGFGAFAQAQAYFPSARYALGLQVGSVFGIEAGLAYRTKDNEHADQWGAHLGLYGSLGFVTLAFRSTLPFGQTTVGGLPRQGAEYAGVLGLKIPIPIYGDIFGGGNLVGGRLLRDGDAIVIARVEARDEESEGPVPLVAALDEATRAELAREWTRDALFEHASITAFDRLAIELDRCGAPRALIELARRSAREEIEHARRAFAIASTYAGRGLGASETPALHDRPADLATLAREAFLDGVVGEGVAARAAKWSWARASDLAVRETLAIIARDEASHAELGWKVIDFALGLGADEVRRALAIALDDLEATTITDAEPSSRLELDLLDHGRVPPSILARITRTVRASSARTLRARLHELAAMYVT